MKKLTKLFKSRKSQAIFVICIALLSELIFAILYSIYHDYETSEFIETLYYASQIITSIFVISGVVIAVWQYYLSSKDSRTSFEVMQVQRAIDLSEYYKNNILSFFPAIHYIFDATGILKIFETINKNEIIDFDSQELNRVFKQDQIQRLKEIQESEPLLKAILEANEIYNLHLDLPISKVAVEKEGSATENCIIIRKDTVLVAFLSNLINKVLNNMEFFALHFRHNTADESVVYQSLHQSYLDMVPLLYYYIAKQNIDSSNKYYTNVIWLYETWMNRKKQQILDRSEKSRSVQSTGTIIEK